MRVLETERICLRSVEEHHLEELLRLQWDREIMKLMNFTPLSMVNQKNWLASLTGSKTSKYFSVFLKDGDSENLIGLITLSQINHLHQRASWGLKIDSSAQGKGVGTETALILLHYGFSYLNMNKMFGDILVDNTPNRKLCAKIGHQEEGVLEEHYFQNGQFRDVVLVGLKRSNFYSVNKERLLKLGVIDEYFSFPENV